MFEDAEVTVMESQGQKSYQIVGEPVINERTHDQINEDIKLIMDQTNCTEDEARNALKESNGDIAEAILKLTG